VAIISAGYGNSFGHPNKDVLARLTERHSAVFRTDLDGLVTVRTDGRRLWFDSMALDSMALDSIGSGGLWEPAWRPALP
jgi:beta-lactamase superfamily II metal-dependent hydrolase